MADDTTTDTRNYLIMGRVDDKEAGTQHWVDVGSEVARNHDEALRLWAVKNPVEETKYPMFRLGTESAVKERKGEIDTSYRISQGKG